MAGPGIAPQQGRLGSMYHYAWVVVAIAVILQVTTNAISQAFSVLIPVILEEFEWSLTAISLAYVFRSIVGAVLSPAAGWVGDRYGARRSLVVATGCYIIGLLLLSTITQVWQLYLYYSVVLGVSQALFRVNIPTTVAAWFRRKLGVAVGVQQAAGGMGASVMAPGLALLLSHFDWQTSFYILPAIGGVIVVTLVFLFPGEPADKGKRPYGDTGDAPTPTASPDAAVTKLRSKVFLQHARRTRAFWNLIAIHHLGCVGHSIVMVWAVTYAVSQGVSLASASWIVSLYSFASIASRLAVPILADRLGAKWVMALAYAIQGVTVAMLFWTQTPWEFYLFSVLFGIGLGGEMSAFLVINRQYYGMGPVRTIFGFQSMGSGLGMALGGLLGGVVFDMFGSYDVAWYISIFTSLGGAACILFLEPTSRVLIPDWEQSLPEEARTPAPAPSR